MMSLASVIFAIILPFFGLAAGSNLDCKTEIRLNDANSKIQVDGVAQLFSVPMFINCKDIAQSIRVISSDDQEFVRILPAAKDFSEKDSLWNVFFLPRNSQTAHAAVDAGHAQLQDSYQVQILNELSQIRKLFESLIVQHPELKRAAEMKIRAATRAPSAVAVVAPSIVADSVPEDAAVAPSIVAAPDVADSVAADSGEVDSDVAVSMVINAGIYVQLYSFLRKDFNSKFVIKEIANLKSEVAGAVLKFCKWRHRQTTPLWTRVVVGPFVSEEKANQVIKSVGRDTFTVKDLNCYGQVLNEVEM